MWKCSSRGKDWVGSNRPFQELLELPYIITETSTGLTFGKDFDYNYMGVAGKDSYEIEVTLPGYPKENVKVLVRGRELGLTIKAEKVEGESRCPGYQRSTGPLSSYNVSKAVVTYKDGLLKISVPLKTEETKELEIL